MLTAFQVGERLRKARLEHGYTQEKLGQLILNRKGEPLSRSNIYHLEQGKQEPYFYYIIQAAHALGKPISYFI